MGWGVDAIILEDGARLTSEKTALEQRPGDQEGSSIYLGKRVPGSRGESQLGTVKPAGWLPRWGRARRAPALDDGTCTGLCHTAGPTERPGETCRPGGLHPVRFYGAQCPPTPLSRNSQPSVREKQQV